jgi:hypothetical protein
VARARCKCAPRDFRLSLVAIHFTDSVWWRCLACRDRWSETGDPLGSVLIPAKCRRSAIAQSENAIALFSCIIALCSNASPLFPRGHEHGSVGPSDRAWRCIPVASCAVELSGIPLRASITVARSLVTEPAGSRRSGCNYEELDGDRKLKPTASISPSTAIQSLSR